MGGKLAFIMAAIILSVATAGCMGPSYMVYDSGKIRFEYPSEYKVVMNNTENVRADNVGIDLFKAGIAFNDTSNPDHESVAVTKYNNMTLDEAINMDTGTDTAEDNSLGDYGASETGMKMLWYGNIQGRPAALLSNIYSVPDLPLWELDVQDDGSLYTILFWSHTTDWRNTTLGGEPVEVPNNLAHIIETLKFH